MRNRKLSRILAVALLLCLMATLLAPCALAAEDGETPTEDSVLTDTPAEETAEPEDAAIETEETEESDVAIEAEETEEPDQAIETEEPAEAEESAEAEDAAAAEEAAQDGAPGGGPGGSSSSSISYSGATTITSAATQSSQTYTSTTADQNALLINTSGSVTITNPTVTKSGGTSASDNYSFYGINSGILCKGGGTTTITGGTVKTTAAGANGIFCFGGYASTNNTKTDGTTVIIRNTAITTTGSGSGGIMTTGGGTTYAYDLTISTSGGSSAAIRTDRGGGNVTVDGGTYKTSGTGSPAVYATATIKVSNATLTSTASQGIVNEGGNDVYLYNCVLNAGNKTRNGQDKFNNGIFLYQSMSGDAKDGASVFEMYGGTLNNTYGHVIHVTNTSAAIVLSGVDVNNADTEKVFLSVCDDAWSGLSNAATLTAIGQTIEGDMLVGSDSTLTLKLTNGSTWTGTTSGKITDHKNKSTISTSLGTVNVTLDSTSKWYLTANTYVKSFSGSAANVISNGYTLYVNGKALAGTSDHDKSAAGLVKNASGTWVYMADDAVDTSYTGLARNDYGWWYVKNGVLDLTYTGLAKNAYGWWYVKNGKLDTSYTGLAKNAYGWWYVKEGRLNLTYTGLAKNAYGWWYVKNGKLDLTYTGMAKNAYGWWYVSSGKLDLTFTGIAKNDYGTWYLTNGRLAVSYSGTVTYRGRTYTVVNGEATMNQ